MLQKSNIVTMALLVVLCSAATFCAVFVVPDVYEIFSVTQFTEDPVEAAQIGQSIIDYQLPSNYVEEGGVNFFGIRMVFIVPREGEGLGILLAELTETDPDEPGRQAQIERQFSQRRGFNDIALTQVSTQTTTINNQPARLTLSEGQDGDEKILQLTGVFRTKNDVAGLIMFRGPEAVWNEDEVEQVLRSME